MSRITDLLGCRYPVIQGAMGVISNPELVSAVSEAGGFGLLATTFARDPEIVSDQEKATKQLTDKSFGANLFVMNPLASKFAEMLAEQGVKCVTVSGGSLLNIEAGRDRRERQVTITEQGREVLMAEIPLWAMAQKRMEKGLGS